jgi:serine/threonine protein kinase
VDPERWHRVNELFHGALERDLERRAKYLDDACIDDPSLRKEVESLLAHHEAQATGLLRTPQPDAVAGNDAGDSGDSLVGRQIGQYAITDKLGEGGMGVVYLAEDTRLGRSVAIKALAQEFTRDDQRRRRLRREARAAAAVSHPGIATVYALEEFDDVLYIVSEYVRGKTVRSELAAGPLPADVVMNTAVEMARALTAAHEHGVVHRDLKPENVIRTADGGLKILDFGLARFEVLQLGPGASTSRLTEPGAMLGTPGYMAPEQIRGANVDSRADLFALGVFLFELLSGLHPFAGSGQVSTIARVIEVEAPSLSQLAPNCPAALERIIRKCLQKDRNQRHGTTRELLDELERVRRDLADEAVPPPSVSATSGFDSTRRASRSNPAWWWQFHQGAAGLVYYAMLYPLWKVRDWAPAPWGSLLFFSTLAAVLVAANLRFHLWFTLRFNPTEIRAQRSQTLPWIRAADWLFVLLLLSATAVIAGDHAAMATLIVAVSIVSLLAFLIIEPATTRPAFQNSGALPAKDQRHQP